MKVMDESTSLDFSEDDLHRRKWHFRFKEHPTPYTLNPQPQTLYHEA